MHETKVKEDGIDDEKVMWLDLEEELDLHVCNEVNVLLTSEFLKWYQDVIIEISHV